MAWIKQIDEEHAEGELAEVYAGLLEKRGKLANILKVQSLNPGALGAHVDLYMATMFAQSGLSRAEREAIAVVVSTLNDCEYCTRHHLEVLRSYIEDDEILQTLVRAENLDELEPRLGNIVMHAEKLTSAPGAMTESDLHDLRSVGLTDKDILDLTLVVAYFNFVNRIAMGLGVEFSDAELTGYKNED